MEEVQLFPVMLSSLKEVALKVPKMKIIRANVTNEV